MYEPQKPLVDAKQFLISINIHIIAFSLIFSVLSLLIAFSCFLQLRNKEFIAKKELTPLEDYAISKHLMDSEYQDLKTAQENGDREWAENQQSRFDRVKGITSDKWKKLKESY